MGEAAEELDLEGGERIPSQVDLRKKVREVRGKGPADDPVAKAEAALKRLSTSFLVWIEDEITRIETAWRHLVATGISDRENRLALYRAAHDLKGQAATLGFPLVGRVAASLTTLLEQLPPSVAMPELLVSQHVDAMRAIVRENAREPDNEIASMLAARLEDVTGDFVRTVQAKR
jgi:Hpt domain.